MIVDRHVESCQLHGAKRVKLPEKNDVKGCDKIKFTKTEYQLRLPFVMYADFESILKKHDVHKTMQQNHGHLNIVSRNMWVWILYGVQ